ncbi:MAG TPA: hypothetical protein VD996_00865 [Chitinophagaceae bacterium]|nr:hypothetical protein [Chitinophagaceae bacterium]
MNDHWRYTAKSVTKYNPALRDENGYYKKNEWTGFFQIGQMFDGEIFTIESYLETEKKYIEAAIYFFEFHNCDKIILKGVEKYSLAEYNHADLDELSLLYNRIAEGDIISIKDLATILKLILRELMWAELFCSTSNDVALHFGYDFYMYFSSDQDMNPLFERIKEIGLFVY